MSGGHALVSRRFSVRAMGTGGYLACLAFAMIVAMLAQGWRLAVACALVAFLAGLYFPKGLRVLGDRRFVLFLLLVLIPPALLMEPKTLVLWSVALSQDGFASGLQMALRATTIAVAVTGFAATVSVGELSRLLEQAGFKGLGFALGVAMNMLPIIKETVGTVYLALRMRGGFRRRRLQALRLMLVTVIVQSLRHADNIVNAAEARAFSVDRTGAPGVALRRDASVYALLLVIAILLVV